MAEHRPPSLDFDLDEKACQSQKNNAGQISRSDSGDTETTRLFEFFSQTADKAQQIYPTAQLVFLGNFNAHKEWLVPFEKTDHAVREALNFSPTLNLTCLDILLARLKRKQEKDDQTDLVDNLIGPYGKYQQLICMLILVQKIPMACLQQSVVFLSPKVSYICEDTGNQTCPCENPIYDRSVFTNTVIMEWDLICERKWLNSFMHTLYYGGIMVGSPLLGMASDRFGRRWLYLASTALQASAGIGAYFATNFWAFAFCRFLLGASVGGILAICFIYIIEFTSKAYRDIITIIYNIVFAAGYMLMPVVGYFLRDFYNFQLATTLPSVVFLCYVFLLPETPRWLIANNKTENIIRLLEHTARVNKRPTDEVRSQVVTYGESIKTSQRKGTIVDLFKTPNLRKNILAMSFNWFSTGYCFYGVTQYVGQLAGNIFVNVWLIAVVSLIGVIALIPLLKAVGRRTMFIVLNLATTACLLVLTVVPDGVASVSFAILGITAMNAQFMVSYLYVSELFPTVLRNASMGFSSMLCRVGSMIAPFVIDLHDYGLWAPPVAFALLPLIAACVALLLPETKGCKLMHTVEEGENYGKKMETC